MLDPSSWFGALLGALVVGMGWLIRESVKKNWREHEQLQADRMKVYMDVIDPFVRVLSGTKNRREGQRATKEIASHTHRMNLFRLQVMGSDESVRAMNRMMEHFFRHGEDPSAADAQKTLHLIGTLLLAIRKDLGHKGSRLTSADMFRSHVTDLHRLLDASQQLSRKGQ